MNRSEAQVLEAVESALDGRMGMVEAAHALLPLLTRNSDLASQGDFDLIRGIESETDDLPIGRVREHWHLDSLREKDRELARCEGDLAGTDDVSVPTNSENTPASEVGCGSAPECR